MEESTNLLKMVKKNGNFELTDSGKVYYYFLIINVPFR